MLSTRRRIGLWGRLAFIPLVLVLAVAVAGAACGTGVSEEEFEALQQDLADQESESQSLESQLAQVRANIAGLQERVDEAEVQKAGLESQLVQERAITADLQERVDKAEVQQALLVAFLAWNRKDTEGFAAGFTDKGISETFYGAPIGEPPITIRRVMDVAVSGDAATIHAMFAFGTQRRSVRESLVKEDGVWKIDNEEQLSPKIKGNTAAVDIQLNECVFAFDSNAITGGNVGFRVENVGNRPHHLTLNKVPEELDLVQTLQGDGPLPEGIEAVAFSDTLKPSEQINVAFSEPLDPGRYLLLCFLSDDPEHQPHVTKDMVAEFTVN